MELSIPRFRQSDCSTFSSVKWKSLRALPAVDYRCAVTAAQSALLFHNALRAFAIGPRKNGTPSSDSSLVAITVFALTAELTMEAKHHRWRIFAEGALR